MTREIYDILYALCEMWDQYCPKPYGHMCMTAGENAEEILDRYNLLKNNNGYGGEVDWDILEKIKNEIL